MFPYSWWSASWYMGLGGLSRAARIRAGSDELTSCCMLSIWKRRNTPRSVSGYRMPPPGGPAADREIVATAPGHDWAGTPVGNSNSFAFRMTFDDSSYYSDSMSDNQRGHRMMSVDERKLNER